MTAVITQAGSSYKGKFLDGAAGKGLDVISGTVTDRTRSSSASTAPS